MNPRENIISRHISQYKKTLKVLSNILDVCASLHAFTYNVHQLTCFPAHILSEESLTCIVGMFP